MSVQGVCHVCENALAEYTCTQCGGVVCETHYDEATSTCVACATTGGGRVDEDDVQS